MKALEHFIETYQELDKNDLALLGSIYSKDIRFSDPLHQIVGLEALIHYFKELYQNVDSVTFTFGEQLIDNHKVTLCWVMTIRHPRLNNGQDIRVEGISLLNFNAEGLVSEHRDYFDLGAMLYEHIPLLGRIIRKLKERLAP